MVDSTFVESAYGCKGTGISGHKRAKGNIISVAVDKHGDVLAASVNSANTADSTAAQPLIEVAFALFSTLKRVLGDSAYDRTALKEFLEILGLDLDTTSPPLPKGVHFLPRPVRWVVEQYFGWLMRWRRLAKNYCYEALRFTSEVRWCIMATAMKRATSSV